MSQPIKIGLIGGSGLGQALAAREIGTPFHVETPFGRPSGPIYELTWGGLPVLILQRHGLGHTLSPTNVPYRANIFALKQLGCTHVIASGAVGSLREEYRPRDLVIVDQTIDKTTHRASTFFEKAAVHVEFAEPFCPVLRRILVAARERIDAASFAVHEGGTYVCMEGPAFSSRAESMMHRLWGGDLIGMTAMPEAKLAREAELPYALVALVTDYDSWRLPAKPAGDAAHVSSKHELLDEITANLRAASDNAIALMKAAVELIGADPAAVADCPASSALERAIWSEKSRIDKEEIDRLRPLWGRYFDSR